MQTMRDRLELEFQELENEAKRLVEAIEQLFEEFVQQNLHNLDVEIVLDRPRDVVVEIISELGSFEESFDDISIDDVDVEIGKLEQEMNKPLEPNNLSDLINIGETENLDQGQRGMGLRKDRIEQTNVEIFAREKALQKAREHAASDKANEVGGVLLGTFRQQGGKQQVFVTGIVRALKAVGRSASVNFTPDTWAHIWRKIDTDPDYQDEQKWKMVGWYHTHPNFGIFLSSMDLSIHHGHFAQPSHVALVIDPVRDDEGFFCWRTDKRETMRCPKDKVNSLNDEQLQTELQVSSLPTAEIETAVKPQRDELVKIETAVQSQPDEIEMTEETESDEVSTMEPKLKGEYQTKESISPIEPEQREGMEDPPSALTDGAKSEAANEASGKDEGGEQDAEQDEHLEGSEA